MTYGELGRGRADSGVVRPRDRAATVRRARAVRRDQHRRPRRCRRGGAARRRRRGTAARRRSRRRGGRRAAGRADAAERPRVLRGAGTGVCGRRCVRRRVHHPQHVRRPRRAARPRARAVARARRGAGAGAPFGARRGRRARCRRGTGRPARRGRARVAAVAGPRCVRCRHPGRAIARHRPRTVVVALGVGCLRDARRVVVAGASRASRRLAGRGPLRHAASRVGARTTARRDRRHGAARVVGGRVRPRASVGHPPTSSRGSAGPRCSSTSAISWLAPFAARPIARGLGAALPAVDGNVGCARRENTLRNARRSATTAATLMVGVSLMSLTAIAAASARASIGGAIDEGLDAQLVLSGPELFPFSPAARDAVAASPTVAAATRGAARQRTCRRQQRPRRRGGPGRVRRRRRPRHGRQGR